MIRTSDLPDTFLGYRRADGTVGIRNHLAVIPSVVCANTVAQRVASLIPGAVAIPHPHGCAQVGDDVVLTEQVLAGAAANPNVGAALIVGLGCETCQANDVAGLARRLAPGRPIESFTIQEAGGSIKAIARGVELGKALMAQIAARPREPVPLGELILGARLGEADGVAGLRRDPAVVVAAGIALAAGATVIEAGTAGNDTEPADLIGFAQRPHARGRFAMKTPEHDAVSLSAMAAGGAQLCIFTTNLGSPLGNAIAPVVKVCADAGMVRKMEDNVDFSTASLVEGTATQDELGARLFELIVDVCNGRLTNAEIIGHQEFAIHRIGPTV
ncbi:MAG: UxaA family hydrolase [Chloroflexi bacterium]|nr:UxaA family hydrolase [Chloroflexota bacterium]